MTKICSGCKIEKNETEFSQYQFGHKYGRCRDCVRIGDAKYKEKHPERVKASKRNYYLNNIEAEKLYSRVYGKNNKDKRNLYLKNKRKNDPFFRFTIDELKQHLEQQFEPWMTWENHGAYCVDTWNDNDPTTWTWQIDHIIPQNSLPYTSMTDENFKKCWALENLRPLSAKENVFKSDKIEA